MIKKVLIALSVSVAVCGLLIGYVVYQAKKVPANNVDATLKTTTGNDKKITVCLGDSITHGAVSFDYVGMLSVDPELKEFTFVNEGINSRLAYNLLQIVGRVVALKPRHVFILIGTNDLKATLSDKEYNRYDKLWDLPQKPTKKWFAGNYKQLVYALKTKTDAKVVLISIPPLGEDIESAPFKLAADYSRLIKEIAVEMKVSYLPFNEILTAELVRRRKKVALPYSDDPWFMYTALLKHYLFCKDWDAISDNRGLQFLTDNIHLNSRCGKILAAKIKEALSASGT